MPAAVVGIGALIGGVAGAVVAVVGPIAAAVAAAVGPIVAGIGSAISAITASVSSAVAGLWTQITTAVGPLVTSLKSSIVSINAAIDAATSPILTPIMDAMSLVHTKLEAVDAWMVEELTVVHDALEIANAASTVKLLVDLVKGNAAVTEVIGKVAEGEAFETAVAIAELSKSIVTLGTGMVDRIDEHWKLTKATITTWDEQFKINLAEAVELQKTELLAVVTPKMDVLGEHQLMVTRDIARIYRHMEDVPWFAAMLVRALR